MSRTSICLWSIVCVGVAAAAPADPAPAPRQESKAQKVRKRLAEPTVNLDKGIDPNTPLRDVAEFLTDTYDLPVIVINTLAFEAIGVQKADETRVQLPKMTGVSLNLVLRKVLDQVRGTEGTATFLICNDHIEITTTRHANPRQWTLDRKLAPVAEGSFDRVCLDEALESLGDQTGICIVLDSRLAEKGRKPVTARLTNTKLDTAVTLLADMADLQAVALDNVLYVTTKENAKAILAEQRQAEVETARLRKEELKRRKEDLERRQQENPLVVPK